MVQSGPVEQTKHISVGISGLRIIKYFMLALLVFLGDNALAQQTCCWRHVKTEIAVPPNVSSLVVRSAWDSVFTKREFGGGPLLADCPLSVEPGAPKAFVDYVFRGSLTVALSTKTKQFALRVQLLDRYRGQDIKEGQTEWVCADEIACAKALQDHVRALARTFMPLDDILHDYERMPERVTVEPEKERIMAGKEMTVHLRDIEDSKGRSPQPWQRVLVKAEKGKILNGTPRGEYRVFEAGGAIALRYQAPKQCQNDTETITVYNTCVIDPQSEVMPEREIASANFDIFCDRWEGTITYTEQMSGIYDGHKANRRYSMTIQAIFDFKQADEYQIRYESEDAYIDLHDSFQQTALGGLQESWKASKQGRTPMKVSLELMPKTGDDPSDFSWYNVKFGEWQRSPVIYSYRSKIPLFGQDCKGSSELTHGGLYMLQDMTSERCTYKDNQRLLTGDYSWNDSLGPSVNPQPWNCPDRLGLPHGIPSMIYHKHLKWKIQKLSK